ncbi:MAG: SPOR domain-containing protein [candidate division KSB1 bacterium]|nr:SPOR domain-containing protein [candidate division KSB1 bacterium]
MIRLFGIRTVCLLLLLAVIGRSGDRRSAALDSLYAAQDWEALQRTLLQYRALYPHDANLDFFRAVLTADADSARTLYLKFLEADPQSPYADQALLRLGQYYFAVRDYSTARSYFARLFRNFIASPLRDDAQFLYCQCVLAEDKVDSARAFLNAFVRRVSESPFVDQAVWDLEQIGAAAAPPKAAYYAVQAAAFRDEAAAQEAAQKIRRLFPLVEVKFDSQSGNLWYILIGKFSDRQRAERYADLYLRPTLKNVRIVAVEN